MPIFIFTKERRNNDKTKRIATEKERRKIMGQRSQIMEIESYALQEKMLKSILRKQN